MIELIRHYFGLQYKRLDRKLRNLGTIPLVVYLLLPLLFVLLSYYLFSKSSFAALLLVLSAFYAFLQLSDTERNYFLKNTYTKPVYQSIRMLENGIISLPFLIVLLLHKAYGYSFSLLILTLIMALYTSKKSIAFYLPTPFAKRPFEFILGFRKTFWAYPIIYGLCLIAILVKNFNLGLFSVLVLSWNCYSYYSKVEESFYVWNYKFDPKKFLFLKLKIALQNFLLLSMPLIVSLLYFFPEEYLLLLLLYLFCSLYMLTFVLGKYAAFPEELDVVQAITIALSLLFPPLLIFIMLHFYSQAKQKLNPILND